MLKLTFFCPCSFLIFISFCRCSSFHFQAASPCHRHSSLPFQARVGLHQLWALPWLLLIAFAFSSTASATILSEHFLPTGVFYLALLQRYFWFNLRSSLKFAGLHTDLRNSGPAPLLVWITVIHNLHIQNNSVLSSTIYYHELLVVKSLVYMLLTCFELFSLVQSICKDY